MEDFINTLNIANTDWSNTESVLNTVGLYILLVILLGLIFYVVVNYKKIISFLRLTILELRKVDWFERSKTVRLTILTIVFIIGSTLYIYGVDQIFFLIRNSIFDF